MRNRSHWNDESLKRNTQAATILTPSVCRAFKTIASDGAYPAGHKFFAQSQLPSGVYMLYSGRVQLSIAKAGSDELVIGVHVPGDILGLSAAVSGMAHEETAVATFACRAGFISSEDFLHFLDHHPEAAFQIVQLLSGRVTSTMEQLYTVGAILRPPVT